MLIYRRNALMSGSSEYWGLCFTADEATVISMVKNQTPGVTPVLKASTNGFRWVDFTPGVDSVSLKAGEKCYFKAGDGGNVRFATGHWQYWRFNFTGYTRASGSLYSLLNGEVDSETCGGSYTFSHLFTGQTKLLSAPRIDATLANGDNQYLCMFENTGLTDDTLPELPSPALTNGCYYGTFGMCKNITRTPELPSTDTGKAQCMQQMFQSCTSLTKAADINIRIINGVDGMFQNCTALKTPPRIFATSFNNGMAEMFANTRITTLPEFHFVNLQSNVNRVNWMLNKTFRDNPSLTSVTMPPIVTPTNRCYYQTFMRCANLVEIHTTMTSFQETNPFGTYQWLSNVSPTGVFYCPSSLKTKLEDGTYARGASTVPEGWTIVAND